MFAVIIALSLLVVAVGAIYVLLRNMGDDGIEVAAPGSCKSGRCGVRKCADGQLDEPGDRAELAPAVGEDQPQEDAVRTARPQQRPG